jgi:hypothetical protein
LREKAIEARFLRRQKMKNAAIYHGEVNPGGMTLGFIISQAAPAGPFAVRAKFRWPRYRLGAHASP